MRVWIALLVAPTLMLLDQAIAYATAGWACANQNSMAIHGVHAIFLAATLASAFAAWPGWHAAPRPGDEAAAARRFLAGVATAAAAFSALVIVAMWIPGWIVASCYN